MENGANAKKKKILVVTEDVNLQRSMILILRRAGWDAVGISSGMEVLHRLWGDRSKSESFDLIIADVGLQGLSATSFLESLQHWGIVIPFALVISDGSVKEYGALRERGCRFCLSKPFSSQDLVARVLQALSNTGEHARLNVKGVG